MSLVDFCARIAAYQNAEISILDHSPYHEAEDAVVLQSVHSSKGLEYEYVFMIAVDNNNWANAKGNNDRLALPRNLEYVRHTGDSADEKLRVFFVAITRAKSFLYISYSLSDFTGKENDRLKFLDTYEQDDKIISRAIPKEFNAIIPSTSDEITPKEISTKYWLDNYIPNDEVRKNLYRPKVEHFRLSPTHVNTFIDIEYGGPTVFFENYIIGIRGEGGFAVDYGNFIHEVLDQLNKEHLSNEEAYLRYQSLVESSNFDEAEKKDLHDRGAAELPLFLEARGDQYRSTKTDSERSFFSQNIVVDDVLIGGKIDRIEIDEKGKTITVADFKTSKIKYKWNDKDDSIKLKLQLYFYKYLIENSRDYAGYRVTTGRIDFIRPDKNSHIHSLELTFNESENEYFKKIIKAVYYRIKTLDFEPATVDYKTIKDFADSLLYEQ
jgi:DNA helicase-2/ATP-dependent DNA helicase PcrA